jgi:hypothetical protein
MSPPSEVSLPHDLLLNPFYDFFIFVQNLLSNSRSKRKQNSKAQEQHQPIKNSTITAVNLELEKGPESYRKKRKNFSLRCLLGTFPKKNIGGRFSKSH